MPKDETQEAPEDKNEETEEKDDLEGLNLSEEERAALEEGDDEQSENKDDEDDDEDEDEDADAEEDDSEEDEKSSEDEDTSAEEDEETTETEEAKGERPFEPNYQVADDIEEIDKQIEAVDELRDELGKLLDDAEITVSEYHSRLAELSDQKTTLIIAKSNIEQTNQFNQQTRAERWKWEVESFLDSNPDFNKPARLGALQAEISELQNTEEAKGKPMKWFLQEARERVLDAFGLKPVKKEVKDADTDEGDETEKTEAKQEDKPAKKQVKKEVRPKVKKAVPAKTLGDVPSGGTPTEETQDEFSYLDNMKGMELEQALAKLSPDKMERYADTRNLHQ